MKYLFYRFFIKITPLPEFPGAGFNRFKYLNCPIKKAEMIFFTNQYF